MYITYISNASYFFHENEHFVKLSPVMSHNAYVHTLPYILFYRDPLNLKKNIPFNKRSKNEL